MVKARWADPSGVERVPVEAAVTRPSVFLAGRPAAQRAADARAIGIEALVFLKLAIQNVRFCSITHTLMFSSDEKPILSLCDLYRT
jgi:hypothetical protein